MELFSRYSDLMYFGNSVQHYLLTIVVLIAAFLVFKLVVLLLMKRLGRLACSPSTTADDYFVSTITQVEWIFYLIADVFIIDLFLDLGERAEAWVTKAYVLLFVLLVIRTFNSAITYTSEKIVKRKAQGQESVRVFAGVTKIVVWIFGVIFLLSSFGYNITSLIAGLGIGGIAVALAAQNILSDLFSSFSIYIDKPFVVGDFIIVGDKMGTVERIGLKTTRMISMAGEELVIPNASLTGKEIQNFGRVKRRRGVIELGVTYDTPLAKMKKLPEMMKKIIESYEDTEFDRGHFKGFGSFSKNFEFVYYVATKEYPQFLDRQQQILFDIQLAFDKEKISFAFPTQTVHMKKE